MDKLKDFVNGNKTYIVIILAAIGFIVQAQGVIIPEFVWQVLTLLGLGAIRSAMKKIEV